VEFVNGVVVWPDGPAGIDDGWLAGWQSLGEAALFGPAARDPGHHARDRRPLQGQLDAP